MARLEKPKSPAIVGRPVVDDSMIVRGGRTLVDRARRLDAALGRVPLPDPDPADEERVKVMLTSSRLVAWIDRALGVPPRAWRSSTLRRLVQPTVDALSGLPAAGRIRVLGWTLVVATITHVVLVLAVAEPVGWPTWAGWLSFLVVALVLACWPSEVVAAWGTSRIRRRMHREP